MVTCGGGGGGGSIFFFFLRIRRPPRSTLDRSSAASDVYKRQERRDATGRESGQQNECGHGGDGGRVAGGHAEQE